MHKSRNSRFGFQQHSTTFHEAKTGKYQLQQKAAMELNRAERVVASFLQFVYFEFFIISYSPTDHFAKL